MQVFSGVSQYYFLILRPPVPPQTRPRLSIAYIHTQRSFTHMYTPLYSAWTRTTPQGDTVLMLAVEGFESALEAREFLAHLIAPYVAEQLQETLH